MELSIYLGQLMSPIFLVVGLALLLRPGYYTNAYKSWIKNEGLMLFTAMVVLTTGVAVVILHNVWVASWQVLITLAGWGMILKGILLLFIPKEFDKLVDYLMQSKWLLLVGAIIWIIGGLFLGYFSWIV